MSELHTLIRIKFELSLRYMVNNHVHVVPTPHIVGLFFLIPRYIIPLRLDFIKGYVTADQLTQNRITIWSFAKLKIKMALGTGNPIWLFG
jgi:hypothetical protein